MKASIIHNPAAGQGNRAEDLSQVAWFLRQQGWTIMDIQSTAGPGDATVQARRAAEQGCDLVFAVGGDGTIAQVVNGLVGTETTLAVLPAGTGNVMARQLGLPISGGLFPRSLLESTERLLRGNVRPVDVGRVTLAGGAKHHFLCWCGVGLDAQVNMVVAEEPERKQRLGLVAFMVATVLTLRSYAGTPAVVRVDGHRISRRLMMLVANNIQLYGVWFRMAPGALLDDGWLDVYCFNGRRVLTTLLHAVDYLVTHRSKRPELDFSHAHRIEVVTARPLPVHVDGDTVGYTPVVIDVIPRALKLLVPLGAPTNLFVAGAGQLDTPWTRVVRMAKEAQDIIKGRGGPA